MKIFPVESGPVATVGYLVYDEISYEGAIIDTPLDSVNLFLSEIFNKNINLTSILLTHTHWDHTADAFKLKSETNAKLFVHESDEYRLKDPDNHTIWKLPFMLSAVLADKFLKDGDIIKIGNIEFNVAHTPGHTEGSICLINHNDKVVFSGDLLFRESVGRVDLPGGDGYQLIQSIKEKLMILDDDYMVYSGHGEPTTIGYERKNNQFINGLYEIF